MKVAFMVLVGVLGSAHAAETFLKTSVVAVHSQPEGMESDHAKNIRKGAGKAGQNMKDGAGQVAKQTASAAKTMNDNALDQILGDDAHPSKTRVMNMGEGAYQSASAVMAATTSTNTDCEDGKWHDCYKKAGDYLDHAPPGHKHADSGDKQIQKLEKSAASPVSHGLGLILAVGLAVQT